MRVGHAVVTHVEGAPGIGGWFLLAGGLRTLVARYRAFVEALDRVRRAQRGGAAREGP
jgi:hypothetical protein